MPLPALEVSTKRSDRESLSRTLRDSSDLMAMMMLTEGGDAFDVVSSGSGRGGGGGGGGADAGLVRSPMSFSGSFAGLAPTALAGVTSIIANVALTGEDAVAPTRQPLAHFSLLSTPRGAPSQPLTPFEL